MRPRPRPRRVVLVPGRCGRPVRRCEQPERGPDDQGVNRPPASFKINARTRVAMVARRGNRVTEPDPTPRRCAPRNSRITGDRVCSRDPTSATARVSPSPMIKPVPASIRARVGNKLGTVLATSAPCGHNAKTPRRRRASLGSAEYKHHRNLFPTPRLWQTRRTQNPVLARGCGFKSHLRY